MTDEEIVASVLNPTDVNSGSDTESDEEVKISHEEGLSIEYKYLEFLWKQHYISEQETMTIERLQKKIIENKPTLSKLSLMHFLKIKFLPIN